MGCEVVSVYDDQVSGLLGYPQIILNDLHKRDFSTSNQIKRIQKDHPYKIYGFNQSYTFKNLFTYLLNSKQYFVYSSGRFLIVAECPDISKQIKAIMHQDKIICLDIRDKLCVTATVGGKVLLWDLQFFQIKFQFQMPEGCYILSSVSLTDSYIFCTDTSKPKNICYCYDYRTCKMLAQATLGSFEPTLKGKSWLNNHHVTVAADGVWFCRYSPSQKMIQITKGMFRVFPKTSMTCIETVDDTYVISGSVDGYIFLWAHYQCQKVMKVGDQSISQFYLHKNKLIVSNFTHNVRVYSYQIIKKKLDPKRQDHQAEIKNGQITQDFVSVILDSYNRSPLQSICISKLQPLIYYAQTRNGIFYNKMIPSSDIQNKLLSYGKFDKKFIQFEGQAVKYFYDGSLWSVSYTPKYVLVKKIAIPTKMFVSSDNPPKRYMVQFKEDKIPNNCFITLLPKLMKICFAKQNKILAYSLIQLSQIQSAHKSIQSQMSHVKLSGDFQLISRQAIQIKITPTRSTTSLKSYKQPKERQQILRMKRTVQKVQTKKQIEKKDPQGDVLCVYEDGIHAGNHRQRLKLIGLMGFIVKDNTYVLMLFDVEYIVVKYDAGKWVSYMDEQYQGDIISEIVIDGQTIKIQERNNIYRQKIEVSQQILDKMAFIHCQPDIDDLFQQQGKLLTIANDSLIFK